MIRGRIKNGQSVVNAYIGTCIYSCQVRVEFLLMVILTFEALSHATLPSLYSHFCFVTSLYISYPHIVDTPLCR